MNTLSKEPDVIKIKDQYYKFHSFSNDSVVLENIKNGDLIERYPSDLEKEKVVNRAWLNWCKEHYAKKRRQKNDPRGPYVMGLRNPILTLEGKLGISDRRDFMLLLLYAPFGNEPLKMNGDALNNTTIAEKVWNIRPDTAKERLSRFVQLELLIRVPDLKDKRKTNYKLNPNFFTKNKLDSEVDFIKIFQRKLQEVYNNLKATVEKKNSNHFTKKKLDQREYTDVIGMLHALLPYFHKDTYYLVKNPNETINNETESLLDAMRRNPKALKHLSWNGIAKICGKKSGGREDYTRQLIDRLVNAGAILKTTTLGTNRFLVHPYLMFKTNKVDVDKDVYLQSVLLKFGQHEEGLEVD